MTGMRLHPGFLYNQGDSADNSGEREGSFMKEHEKREEERPLSWEAADPKPPVIHSGHMEDRR